MTTRLTIVGCGGFGREVYGIATACRQAGQDLEIVGFVDDDPSDRDLEATLRLGARGVGAVSSPVAEALHQSFIVAIGSPGVRRGVVRRLGPAATFATLVHPASTLGQQVAVAPGTVIAPGARLSTNISLGEHVHIDQNVTVGHDCLIGPFARLNPGSCISGAVTIGAGALVGANATILPGLTIGANALVGAGAVVTRDVASSTIVRGVPAR